jgi:DNA-binding protein H-NS
MPPPRLTSHPACNRLKETTMNTPSESKHPAKNGTAPKPLQETPAVTVTPTGLAEAPPAATEPLPVDLTTLPDPVLAALADAAPREIAARQAKREEDLFREFRERARALGVSPMRLAAALGLKLANSPVRRPSLLRPESTAPEASGAKPDGRSAVAPKYRSKDGKQWSGRGGKPQWVLEHLAAGGTMEELAIPEGAP